MAEPRDIASYKRAVGACIAGKDRYHELARAFGIAFRMLQRWGAQCRVTGKRSHEAVMSRRLSMWSRGSRSPQRRTMALRANCAGGRPWCAGCAAHERDELSPHDAQRRAFVHEEGLRPSEIDCPDVAAEREAFARR